MGTSEVHSKLYDEIMSSIQAVFASFSRDGGVPAEGLGEAMRILGMKPTEDQDLWLQRGQRNVAVCGHFQSLRWSFCCSGPKASGRSWQSKVH